jgi:hypothetical protein
MGDLVYSRIIRLVMLALCLSISCCGGGGGGGGSGGGNGMGKPGATLTSLSPASIPAGSPPFTLTVNGTGFVAGGSLTWNGNSLGAYTLVSSTQVTVQIAPVLITNSGNASIIASIPTPGTNASNALTFTIDPFTSSACVLFGSYDFFFTGFDSSGAVTIAGDFGVDANGRVSGEQDFKDAVATRVAEVITGGSCTNSATTNEGMLTLITSAGTSTYAFATQALPMPGRLGMLAASGSALSGSGRFLFTPPAGFFSGDYVLALVGNDSSGGRMGILGRFTDNDNNSFGTPGTLTDGMGDINDNGTLTSSVPLTGTIGVPDVYSRSAVTLNVGAEVFHLALYVKASQLGVAVDVDTDASSPRLAGLVGSQGGAGLYNNGLLSAPVVFSTWGTLSGPASSSVTAVGIASQFDSGAGTFDLEFDTVAGGVASLNSSVAGAAYNVASNGRATMSYTVSGTPHNLVLYLDTFNDGYILDSSANVSFGFFEAQAAGPFAASSVNGTFAGGTWFAPVAASPNGAVTLTLNNGVISGALNGTYAVDPSGRGTATVDLPVFGGTDMVFYTIGPGSIEMMGSDAVPGDAIAFLHQ